MSTTSDYEASKGFRGCVDANDFSSVVAQSVTSKDSEVVRRDCELCGLVSVVIGWSDRIVPWTHVCHVSININTTASTEYIVASRYCIIQFACL